MWRRTMLWVAVLLPGAGCGGDGGSADCVVLGGAQTAANGTPAASQVLIEAKFVLIDQTSFDELGLDFTLPAPIQTNNGGPLGGVSHQGRNVVAPSTLVGGVPNANVLVTNGFRGFQSIVNLDFLSPFDGEDGRIVTTLPYDGLCIEFDDQAVNDIQNFAGGSNLPLLPAADPGVAGDVLYELFDPAGLDALVQTIEADSRNRVLSMPQITVLDGQRALLVLQDVFPQASDLRQDFRDRVQSVVQNPFGIFTGPTIDVRPTVSGTSVVLTVQLGTEALTFYRSVPADVGASQADVEIPVVKPSTAATNVTVSDGGTVVLGGLLLSGQTEPERGIPFLGKVPVIGSLFRNYSDPTRQNLMIVLTPEIIDMPE